MSAAPNLMDAALIADPYGGYGRLREEAPVLRGVAMDGSPAWYVTRQDDVRDLLADHRFVTNPATAGAADPRHAARVPGDPPRVRDQRAGRRARGW
jgi:cytochrome P450